MAGPLFSDFLQPPSRQALAELLAQARMFRELAPNERLATAERFRGRRVAKGDFVFHEGDPAVNLHLLGSGRIKVVTSSEDGREVILRLINPGEIFGGAGVWGEPVYPANAVVQEDALIWLLPAGEFTDLMRTSPGFAAAVVREIAMRLREAEARIRELQTQRVERRVARALLRLVSKTGVKTAEGISAGVPITRADLADLAGTTLTTASRILSGWEAQGIIDSRRERVLLRLPHVLVSIAEDLPAD